jgi:hypothetical protein
LAVDAAKSPKLLVIDPATGSLLQEMSTAGLVTQGYNGKSYPYVLSDIAFTNDGVLIGANSTVLGRENNGYQTGDFHLYKWEASDETPLEDAVPSILLTLPTNTSNSLYNAGNNNSNLMANSMALNGNLDDFTLYFDSHAGEAWTTTYGIRYVTWTVKDGIVVSAQYNDAGWNESQLGADVRLTLSPLNIDHVVIDGLSIKPREFRIDNASTALGAVVELSEDIPVQSTGATYFRYAQRIYMSAPVCEKAADNTYSYKTRLFDITDGFNHAARIGETAAYITDEPAVVYMTSTGVVDNADMDQYLLVGTKAVKYTTRGVVQAAASARIFAYHLTSAYSKDDKGYKINFELNEDAETVEVILIHPETDVEVVIPFGAKSKGAQEIFLSDNDIPEGETFHWSLRVSALNVTRFTRLSDDSDAYKFFAPKGIAIDKSPESPYFGRVYITNTAAGTVSERATTTGIYVLAPDASDITGQGHTAHTGGIPWTGANAESPRKIAVAADGRLFIADASLTNAGIYYMNPATFDAASLFPGATVTNGSVKIGNTYLCGQITAIGIRGSGSATQLYAVDKTVSGSTWKKFVNVYNIGDNTTWTAAPTSSTAASSYLGNDNNSIAPVATGYWAGQYRGAGSNTVANPCLFYYSDSYMEAVFNTAEFTAATLDQSSQNGGMGVNESEKTIAWSYNGGVSVFEYKFNKDGIPVVAPKFTHTPGAATAYDDFAFDYAGNLYAVSNAGKSITVWAMPTDKNVRTTPAAATFVLKRGGQSGSIVPEVKFTLSAYPNPTDGRITIDANEPITSVRIFDISGQLIRQLSPLGGNKETLDVSDLKPGVYLLQVNQSSVVKMVRH